MGHIITEFVGSLPIIADYLKKIQLIKNINTLVTPLRSNHRRLSHGETCFVLILYLLCRPHVMYRVQDWVANTTYLKVLFPDIEPEHFSDDRIGDTLKALQQVGISNLFSAQSLSIIKEFKLSMKQVHCDFTNFTVHGNYDNQSGENSIVISYGFSKAHRPDKKQFVQEVAITSDGGVPVMSQSLDGNTADVTRYIPLWREINNLMGSSDFLTVGDCKLSSEDNLLTIAKGDGYFLAPLAMYSNLKEELREYVLSDEISPIKLDERKKDDKLITYHGFEVPAFIEDPKTGKKYHYRKIFVKSSQLEETKSKTLDKKLTKSIEEIEKVEGKLNRYKSVNTKEKIETAIESILNENKVTGLINYQIDEKITITKKQVGRGRPGPNTVYEDVEVKEHSLSYSFNKQAIEEEKKLCGYFVLCTNKPENELSMKQALKSYKQEWKVEKVFARLKGPLQVVPIYLRLPEHIEAMMYLLMTCAQIFTLMDREAKNSLAEKNEKLAGLFPNKIEVSRPKAEMMLDVFGNIGMVYIVNEENIDIDISMLNELQGKIIEITRVNPIGYDSSYIKRQLNTDEIKVMIKKKISRKVDFNMLM